MPPEGDSNQPCPPFRVTLLGTGAMATFLGARLAFAGCEVTLAGTWAKGLEAIRRHGISIADQFGGRKAFVRALRITDLPDPAPLVLVLVKSFRTPAIAPIAARAVSAEGVILTLQNGLGNLEPLEAAAGSERVSAGVAYMGANLLEPGVVRSGGGARIVIEKRERTSAAACRLRAACFDVTLEDDITSTRWLKLAVNCAVNPLTAILRVPNGALLESKGTLLTIRTAVAEVARVASALGIKLERDAEEFTLEVIRQTARNRSSMLQDVERGARTEVEALNGSVVREADRLGVPVPVNRDLLNAVRQVEARISPEWGLSMGTN